MNKKSKLLEVAGVFFKLGCFAFGGPAAHIALMEGEVVEKRKWMSKEHFLDLMGATNLIPGPNSTEMTMHCGYERAGSLGLFIAGITFIFPAVIITGALAWFYVSFGQLPNIAPFFYGIKPAVLAIILAAVIKLGKKAVKNWELAILGILVISAGLYGLHEVLVLLVAGLCGALYFSAKHKISANRKSYLPFVLIQSSAVSVKVISSLNIFLVFLKVGAILYGSGYVLFAYLDAELVDAGWLSRQELIDAIAIGQFTPGPVLSTATFIGFQLNNFWGAVAATSGIFLPSFLFVLLLNPFIPKMRRSQLLRNFLDAVNVGAVGIMIVVLIVMSIDVVVDWKSVLIAAISLAITFGIKKSNPIWVICGGAIMGYLFHLTL